MNGELRQLVRQILLDDRNSRNSDKELYIKIVEKTKPEFADQVRKVYRNSELPSYESISRTRRYIQEHIPNTQADTDVAAWREVKEEEYRKEYGTY